MIEAVAKFLGFAVADGGNELVGKLLRAHVQRGKVVFLQHVPDGM